MSYLNQPYPNNFQELCAAMPLYYLDVFEMRAILRAQGRLLDGVCGGLENVVDFNFILTADETTIRRWEKALKITYTNQLSLNQRKYVVIGYIIGLGHIGEPEIRKIISLYTDFSVDVGFKNGTVSITLDGIGLICGYANLIETLCKLIPAHLGLMFTVSIRSPTAPVLHVGGGAGAQPSIGVPLEPDGYDFRQSIHAGITSGICSTAGMREDDSPPEQSSVLHTGGAFSAHAALPGAQDTAPPSATTVLRTGGVCTIISNLSEGE